MAHSSHVSSLAPERRWPVLALGLLLLAQAAGLFGLGSTFFLQLQPAADGLINLVPMLNSSAFNLLALLAFITGVGFLRRQRLAWLFAMTLQSLCLLLALGLYARGKPAAMYMVLAYSVGMVLYLNVSDVRAAFRHQTPIAPKKRGAR